MKVDGFLSTNQSIMIEKSRFRLAAEARFPQLATCLLCKAKKKRNPQYCPM